MSSSTTTYKPSSTSGNITTHQPSSTYSYTTTPYPATTSKNIFPPIPPNIPEVIREAIKKVTNVINRCTNDPTDINNLDICFRGIDTITSKDIENSIKLINQYAPENEKENYIKTLETSALFFNRNQEISDDGVNAFGNVIDLSKNAL